MVSFQKKLYIVFLLSVLFSGGLGWVFLLNNQGHFCSTARNLQLTTAEKGPFVLPPLLSHLLSLLPGDPNHWAKRNAAQLVPRSKTTKELFPNPQSTSWQIPEIPSLMFWASPNHAPTICSGITNPPAPALCQCHSNSHDKLGMWSPGWWTSMELEESSRFI